jgi:hypothetical protein
MPTTPDIKTPEPRVGTSAIPALPVSLAPALAAPLAASFWEALTVAAILELAAALEVALALALTLVDPLADEDDDAVELPPPIPGRSSNETSLARSPHRSSRAAYQLGQGQAKDGRPS